MNNQFQKQSFFVVRVFFILLCCSLVCMSCGRKELPLPQKVDHLFSMQDIYVYMNETGALTVMGTIEGARVNVQALELQIEGYDETCPTCPFVPAESFAIDPRDTWGGNMPQNFSFTVMPTRPFESYRWRLIGFNVIAGLPDVRTPVFQVQKEQ